LACRSPRINTPLAAAAASRRPLLPSDILVHFWWARLRYIIPVQRYLPVYLCFSRPHPASPPQYPVPVPVL
jgi:hypothetical protein